MLFGWDEDGAWSGRSSRVVWFHARMSPLWCSRLGMGCGLPRDATLGRVLRPLAPKPTRAALVVSPWWMPNVLVCDFHATARSLWVQQPTPVVPAATDRRGLYHGLKKTTAKLKPETLEAVPPAEEQQDGNVRTRGKGAREALTRGGQDAA